MYLYGEQGVRRSRQASFPCGACRAVRARYSVCACRARQSGMRQPASIGLRSGVTVLFNVADACIGTYLGGWVGRCTTAPFREQVAWIQTCLMLFGSACTPLLADMFLCLAAWHSWAYGTLWHAKMREMMPPARSAWAFLSGWHHLEASTCVTECA